MVASVILVEAQPKVVATGVAVTERLAGAGAGKPFSHGGQHWRAGIMGLPSIVAGLSFDGTTLGGETIPEAMQIRWQPSRRALLAQLAAYHWNDAPITVRLGPDTGLPAVLTSGTVLSVAVDADALLISLADPATDLRKPILTDRYAGTGGLEGPTEWKGKLKRRLWGRLFNIEGEAIDVANRIYCFSDPTRALQAFDEVRDKGAAAAPAALTLLAWQGSVAATFAALQAAAAPQGGGVLCPSIACIKWWTEPAGALCADLRGEVGAGYVETAASLAQRIAGVVSATPFTAGTVNAANLARPIAAGWKADDETGTAAAAMDKLLSDVSLLWVLDAGAITIRRWEWTAPVTSVRSLDVSREQTLKPVSRCRLGYRENHNVMSRDAIAGIVFVTDIAFDDGEALGDRLESMAIATQAVEDLAAGKGKPWFQPTGPSGAESSEQDIWFDTDDGYVMYRRVPGNGRISFGGTVVTFGGSAVILPPWAPAPDQRIAETVADAARAISDARAAQATADEATERLSAIDDDGVLDRGEKYSILIPKAAALESSWTQLDTIAGTFTITTERTAASAARTAWLAQLAAIVPAWNDDSQDSPVGRDAYQSALDGYEAALAVLQKAISAEAAKRAEYALVTGTKPPTDADNTAQNQPSVSGALSLTFNSDYLGAGVTPLPRDVPYKRFQGTTDVTSSAAWTIVASDGVTLTIGAADGVVNITAVSKDTGSFTVRSTYAGDPRDAIVTVQRIRAAAPVNTGSTGNPGTSGSTGVGLSTISTSYGGGDGPAFTCVAGTAGQVALAGTFNVSLYASSGVFSQYGIGKPQWRVPAGTWADVPGGEYTSSSPAIYDKFDGPTDATLDVSVTKTGLTSGTTYEFRMVFRKGSGTSAQTMNFSGTFAGTGS